MSVVPVFDCIVGNLVLLVFRLSHSCRVHGAVIRSVVLAMFHQKVQIQNVSVGRVNFGFTISKKPVTQYMM